MTVPSHHVLVTGGAGFIGSHAVDALLAAGHRVTVLDDLSTGQRANLVPHRENDKFAFVLGDVAEPLVVPGDVTHVLHLAAQVSVVRSMADAATDARVNLVGTLRVLDFAKAVGARRVVFASSAATYGDAPLPADEAQHVFPLSPYGLHKLAGEHHLRIAATTSGATLDTASCRFFNVYGPRQVPGSEYAGVIAIFLARALANKPLTIYGDGLQTRDFVYVGDVVRALLGLLFHDERLDGAVFNVGTGHETTVLELARTSIRETRSTSSIVHEPARAGDVLRSVASVARIRAALGWEASTTLGSGLSRTADWVGFAK